MRIMLQPMCIQDIVGNLDSEDFVPRNIGRSQDYWYRFPKVADKSQESGYSDDDRKIDQKPTAMVNWRSVVKTALRAKDVDFMIRERSMPEPLTGWVSR